MADFNYTGGVRFAPDKVVDVTADKDGNPTKACNPITGVCLGGGGGDENWRTDYGTFSGAITFGEYSAHDEISGDLVSTYIADDLKAELNYLVGVEYDITINGVNNHGYYYGDDTQFVTLDPIPSGFSELAFKFQASGEDPYYYSLHVLGHSANNVPVSGTAECTIYTANSNNVALMTMLGLSGDSR